MKEVLLCIATPKALLNDRLTDRFGRGGSLGSGLVRRWGHLRRWGQVLHGRWGQVLYCNITRHRWHRGWGKVWSCWTMKEVLLCIATPKALLEMLQYKT